MANSTDYRKLSEKLCILHFRKAKVLNRIDDELAYSGEDGILVWIGLKSDPVYAVDISENFDLTAGRVANIVRQLEDKGYVKRVQDSSDLRRRSIKLTEKGRKKALSQYEHIIGTQMDIFEKIGYADASELIRIIRKIAD